MEKKNRADENKNGREKVKERSWRVEWKRRGENKEMKRIMEKRE